MTKEELIEQEAEKYITNATWVNKFADEAFIDGINSKLAKDLTELAVIEGKIEVYISLNTHHHHEIYQLETQRTELLKQLNLEG